MRYSVIISFILIFGLGILLGKPDHRQVIDYEQAWSNVDSLDNIGLYRQALKKVNEIYAASKTDSRNSDEIKALIYKLRFIHVLSEDGYYEIIKELSNEIEDDRIVFKSIKASMLAELYFNYYQNNRWNIFRNEGFKSGGDDNIGVWSPAQFGAVIDSLYQESLSYPEVISKIDLAQYTDILMDSLPEGGNLSMLDLLSLRALNFYNHDELDYSVDPIPDIIFDKMLFSPMDEFLLWFDNRERSESFFYRSLNIMASLLEYQKQSISTRKLLLRSDLNRLDYAYKVYVGLNSDEYYLQALDTLTKMVEVDSLKAEVVLAKAKFHEQRSHFFSINQKDTAKYINDKSLAFNFATRVLELNPDQNTNNQAKNLINNLVAPGLKPAIQKVVFPNRYIPVSLEYKNITELWYWVTKVTPLKTLQSGYSNRRVKPDVFVEGNSPELSGKFNLPDKGDYNYHRLVVDLPPLLEGNYQLLISSSSNPDIEANIVSLSYLRVSNISWIKQTRDNEKLLINTIDRGSGLQLEGVRVKQYFSKYNNQKREEEIVSGKEFFTDKDGELEISNSGLLNPNRREAFMLLFGSDENGIIIPDRYYLNDGRGRNNPRISQRMFMDRGIYRPGQNIKFAGLLVQEENSELEPYKNHEIEVFFQDATYKIIDTLKLRTDNFGYFRGEFTIPSDGLSGNFQVHTKWGRHGVQVEQYKRPGFNISIDNDSRVYEPGDSIYISGRAEAFAGMKLAGADVRIDAMLNLFDKRFFRHRYSGRKIFVGSKTSILDKEGKFIWALESLNFPSGTFSMASYEFRIIIKDVNGETRETSHRIIVSHSSLQAGIKGPSKINRREGGSWKIDVKSPGGRLVNTDLMIKIARLNTPDRRELPFPLPVPDTWVLKRKLWERHFPRIPYLATNEDDSISSIFTSEIFNDIKGQLSFNPDVKRWGNGRYRIIVSTVEKPDQIIGTHEFDIYDIKRRDFPVRDPLWIDIDKIEYQPGDKMNYFVGSRHPGMYLLEIHSMEEVLLREWIALENYRKKKTLLITKEMFGNISIRLTGIYENNFFSEGKLVKIPRKEKDLQISWLNKSDITLPGKNTELGIVVTNLQGEPVAIKGVMSVYDASLDEIKSNLWNSPRWPEMNSVRLIQQANCFGISFPGLLNPPKISFEPLKEVVRPELNWFGLSYYGIGKYGSGAMVMEPAAAQMKTMNRSEGQEDETELMVKDDPAQVESESLLPDLKDQDQAILPPIRKDFRETAYFNSEFITDKDGKGSVKFEVPDAITKWNIKFYAHDGQLAQVISEESFQSQKQIMLMPNLPRFIRVGDSISLSVKVVYNGEDNKLFNTSIRIENSLNGNELVHQDKSELELSPGSQSSVKWTFKVPDSLSLVEAIFEIDGDGLHDGISSSISVLPKVLRFWEAQNFYLNDVSGVKLKTGFSTENATLEINTQPIWMAVQALPLINENEIACSEYWFSRYFTANLIKQLAQTNPDIKKNLENLAGEFSEDPRLNPFLRNQEMRRFSLGAGLWNGADIDEAMHITQLAEAFDPSTNAVEIEKSLKKLKELQLSDGSWPWFKGMRPDFRMTLHILGGLGELLNEGDLLMEKGSTLENMIRGAAMSVDRSVFENYNRYKIAHPDDDPPLSSSIIFYLYVRSLFSDIEIMEKGREARDYYFEKAGVEWLEKSITEQAFIAISHYRSGDKKVSDLIFNSLLDRRIDDDKGGSFWKIDRQFRGWQERDIWQQSRLIELFRLLPEGREYIDELKTWLLMQKRSRDWSDRISTAMAVKSLILYGSDWYSSKPEIKIKSNSEDFSPLRINLGTDKGGFYRYYWNEEDLREEALVLNIEKSGDAPVWGSLFEESTIDIDTLGSTGADLKIRRVFLVEKLMNGAVIWALSTEELKVGQKIRIRLEVEADQAVDYVQIRDFRPSSFEPDKSLSGYRWNRGISQYQSQGDLYTDFYIHHLPKGFSYFEYDLYVEQLGEYSRGYAEIQSQYAPEFMASSSGGRIEIR